MVIKKAQLDPSFTLSLDTDIKKEVLVMASDRTIP